MNALRCFGTCESASIKSQRKACILAHLNVNHIRCVAEGRVTVTVRSLNLCPPLDVLYKTWICSKQFLLAPMMSNECCRYTDTLRCASVLCASMSCGLQEHPDVHRTIAVPMFSYETRYCHAHGCRCFHCNVGIQRHWAGHWDEQEVITQ